jgi:hypothetical protein
MRGTAPAPTVRETPPPSDHLSDVMPLSRPSSSSLPQPAKIPASHLVTSAPALTLDSLLTNDEIPAALAAQPAVPAGLAPPPGLTQ